ncbi:hypothetical protein HDU96_003264 [Phlyctochytrium bullatum]|nr:hypothetical protein HDU96_003264 [Phlyctochytrium bullatum]
MWDMFRNHFLWERSSVRLGDSGTGLGYMPEDATMLDHHFWLLLFLTTIVVTAVSSYYLAMRSSRRHINEANAQVRQAVERAQQAETQAEQQILDSEAMANAYKVQILVALRQACEYKQHASDLRTEVRKVEAREESTRQALHQETGRTSEVNERLRKAEDENYRLKYENEEKTKTIRGYQSREPKRRSRGSPVNPRGGSSSGASTEFFRKTKTSGVQTETGSIAEFQSLKEQNAKLRREKEHLWEERQKTNDDLRQTASERDDAVSELSKLKASIKAKGYQSVTDMPSAHDTELKRSELETMEKERDESNRKWSAVDSTLKRKGYQSVVEVPKARVQKVHDGVTDWSKEIPALLASVSNLTSTGSQSVADVPKVGDGDLKTHDGSNEVKIELEAMMSELKQKGYQSMSEVPKKEAKVHSLRNRNQKLEEEVKELKAHHLSQLNEKGYKNLEAVPKAVDVKKIADERDEARCKLADLEGKIKAKGYATMDLVPTGEDTMMWKKLRDEADRKAIKLAEKKEALEEELAQLKVSLEIEESKTKHSRTEALCIAFTSGVLSKNLRKKLATLKEAQEKSITEHATAGEAYEARIRELQAALQATQEQAATLNERNNEAQAQIRSLEGMIDQGRAEFAELMRQRQEAEATAYGIVQEAQQYVQTVEQEKYQTLAAWESAKVYIGDLEHQLNEKKVQLNTVAERVRYFEGVSENAKRDRLAAITATANESGAAQCA